MGRIYTRGVIRCSPSSQVAPRDGEGRTAGLMAARAIWVWLVLLLLLLLQSEATAQTLGHLAADQSPDRFARLEAGARREGELRLYTSLAPEDVAAIAAAFEKKHGVRIQAWRASSENILQRIITESRSGRGEFDVVETIGPELERLSREKLLQAVYSARHEELIAQAVPAHREWASTRLNVFTQAYNTALVRREDLPKRYEDLLDPKWKGKLGIESKNQDWFASVVDATGGGDKGLKFFQDLVAKNGISPRSGHTLLTNMVVSGEVPLALTVYNYMPEQAKKKGAPVEWFAIEPAIARSNAIGVARKAPHPAAALLFHEYMLTDAQPLMVVLDYVPTNTKVASPLKGVKIMITDPIRSLDEAEKWTKLFDDTVLKKAGR